MGPLVQQVGEEQGYKIEFAGISYRCPKLKLYGYATERQIRNAIKKEIKKKEGK